MNDEFYVPSLETALTRTQETNVRDLRKALSVEPGIIYSRFCGSGKTLAVLTYMLSEGLCNETKQALVVAPISALKAWDHNSKTHFSPSVQCLQMDKSNKNKIMNVSLNRYHLVVVNFKTLVGAHEHACEIRRTVLREEIERLKVFYSSWQDTSELSEMDKLRHAAARERQKQLMLYYKAQQTTPTVHEPIPFPDIAEQEETHRRRKARAIDYLFQRRWAWLIMDEAHEGRNKAKSLHAALLAVNAQKRIAMTATICSNGISDFVAMLDLCNQTPQNGWKALSGNVEQCIAYMNEVKRRCVVYSPIEEDRAIEQLYSPTSIVVHMPLDPSEQEAYRNTARTCDGKNAFSRIVCLRQMCDGSAKTRAIVTYLERCVLPHQEKAVIFTGFVEYTEHLGRVIHETFPSLKLVVVTGKTDQKKRNTTFLNDVSRHRGSAVYLVTMKIMALGVDMHFANHALLTSPWWNPAIAEQAMRRITRPQQKLAIRWVTFVMKDTVEESIDLVAYYKNKLNTRLLEGDIDERMLEQITSKCAMQRARMSAGRLREILLDNKQTSAPSVDDLEDDVTQLVLNENTGAILTLLQNLTSESAPAEPVASSSSASSSSSSTAKFEDIMQIYRTRFNVVMDCTDDISLEKAEKIDLSSQIRSAPAQQHRIDSYRQQDIERLLRKRKKAREESESFKKQRAHLSLLERQDNLKKKTIGRQTKMIDTHGNIISKK